MKTRFMIPDLERVPANNQETPPDDQQLTQDQIPPTDQPQPSPTDPSRDYISALENTMREQNATIQRLLAQQQSQPAPVAPAAPQPSQEELNQQFYNKPYETTRNLIQEALRETVQPLVETVKSLRFEGSPYDRMLTKFKNDPRFGQILQDPAVVSAVGQILEHVDLSEQAMQSAIVHAAGLKAMGQLGVPIAAPQPATPTPSNNPSPVLPPHIRPSAPPAPRAGNGNGQARTRELTENERRLMREGKFKSEEDFIKWMEMPAAEVAHTTFDKPTPRT